MRIQPPSPEDQVKFLQNVQRILSEGGFVATYKFALLHALADLSVLKGDDSGAPLQLTTFEIAEQFVEIYWRQALPYPHGLVEEESILLQNTGVQAAVIKRIVKARAESGNSIARLRRDRESWRRIVKGIEIIVKDQPLWRLQVMGRQEVCFLYENVGKGSSVTLRPGVAFCFRRFHPLLVDLLRGAWIRRLRMIKHNRELLGDATDLNEFLFGSDREKVTFLRPILKELQKGHCFYCGNLLKQAGEVDHFIPWSRYPVELGHNFVLAHRACNAAKSDYLAAEVHLGAWVQRNSEYRCDLNNWFTAEGVMHNLDSSVKIARWAYQQTAQARGQVWHQGKDVGPLGDQWSGILGA